MTGAACGRTGLEAPAPAAADVPRLEAAFAEDSTDLDRALVLAQGYRAQQRSTDALQLLERLRPLYPDDPGLQLALALEDLERWSEARQLYQAYEESGPDGGVKDEVSLRVERVRNAEIEAAVADALSREAQLEAQEPSANTVGVFPFAYTGADPAWEPLSLALAELLVTDLAVTGRLDVLERVRVRRLLDEIAAGNVGATEPATAARGGRLLGAGRIVQGRYEVRGRSPSGWRIRGESQPPGARGSVRATDGRSV